MPAQLQPHPVRRRPPLLLLLLAPGSPAAAWAGDAERGGGLRRGERVQAESADALEALARRVVADLFLRGNGVG